MKCYLCNSGMNCVKPLESDKYQKTIGNKSFRIWYKCHNCGLYLQRHNLTDKDISTIYGRYRDWTLRNTTVKESFEKIISLPKNKSENLYRFSWFNSHVDSNKYDTVLDIGSGFGVWPYLLSSAGYEVTCVEPNKDSANFINNELGITCFDSFYDPYKFGKYDIISIVHVLEHIRDPKIFLEDIKKRNLNPDGLIYIEVPESSEFNYLDINHDEFNSLHLSFFNLNTLSVLLTKCGLFITDSHVVKYKDRNLTRLMVLCETDRYYN